MKYSRLSKEQFESLHQEFINFLATQQITAAEWDTLKTTQPEVVDQELDVFSDLIWEGVLKNVGFIEHFSPQQIHLFKVLEQDIQLISISVQQEGIDVTTPEGYQWLREHLMDDAVTFYRAVKPFSDDKHQDLFKLIQEGGQITKGALFHYFEQLVNG